MSTTDNRFPSLYNPQSLLTVLRDGQIRIDDLERVVTALPRKPAVEIPQLRRSARYSLEVDFSDDGGVTFDSPLKAAASTTYQMRIRFEQHQAEPLLLGAYFRWIIPTGWTFRDGFGSLVYEETISNPLHISRLVRSPSPVTKKGFRVLVEKIYV